MESIYNVAYKQIWMLSTNMKYFFILLFFTNILCCTASILMSAYVHDLFQIDMTRAAARVDGLVLII